MTAAQVTSSSERWSAPSARCCSAFTAPSVFPRTTAASAFEKSKPNLSVSTCRWSYESPSISSRSLASPIVWSALLLGRGLELVDELLRILLELPAPAAAEVIHRQVVRDAEEPGRKRSAPPDEAVDRLEHLHEGLLGQILGVVPVADRRLEVGVDAVEVERVELAERVAVAGLGPGDERPHVRPGRRWNAYAGSVDGCGVCLSHENPAIPRKGYGSLRRT